MYQAVTGAKYKAKKVDPDFPTYQQAMSRPDADMWDEAIVKEIKTLTEMNAWAVVPCSMAAAMKKKVIPSTIALRLKCNRLGNPLKYK